MMRQKLEATLKKILEDLDLPSDKLQLDYPTREEHGDYSTNVALQLANYDQRPLCQSSQTIAKAIKEKLAEKGLGQGELDFLAKVEVAGPGFVNFYLSSQAMIKVVEEIVERGDKFGRGDPSKGRRILIEHTSPNINKPLHIGQVRNNTLGMTLSRIFEFLGDRVTKDCINNDRGIHVCKAMWAYEKFGKGKTPREVGKKPDHFVGEFYTLAEKKLKGNPKLEGEVKEMLRQWEAENPQVRALWKKITEWVYIGIKETYRRLGSKHDQDWYESELFEEGKRIVLGKAKEGIFETLGAASEYNQPQNEWGPFETLGAVRATFTDKDIPEKILIRSDGTAIYMTFDIALMDRKVKKYPDVDLYIWVVGQEQRLHFKQLFAIFGKLGWGSTDKFLHLSYGLVKLPAGKMSSRLGTVVLADDLIDKMKKKAQEAISERMGRRLSEKEKQTVIEAVGIGAIKYAVLRQDPRQDMIFDPDRSISFTGDSGPYLQYTHARARSVLARAGSDLDLDKELSDYKIAPEELAVTRLLLRLPDVVGRAGREYAPNLICNYLFDLAQKFNLFYERLSILEPAEDNQDNTRAFRLYLTKATAQVIKTGLGLLGIEAPQQM